MITLSRASETPRAETAAAAPSPRRAQRGEVENVGEVGAGEACSSSARERVEVDGSIELEFLAEAAEEAAPPADVGRWDVENAVEAAGARERAVEERRLVVMGRQSDRIARRIAPELRHNCARHLVRRCEDDDAGVRRESVHLDEQRVERLRVHLR